MSDEIDGAGYSRGSSDAGFHVGGLIFGPATIFVAPPGTPLDGVEDAYDPDGPWTLVHPTCPDTLPEGDPPRG